jgi:hypothetical protein
MTQALNLALFANNLNTSGQTSNTGLQNSSVTVTAGTGLSGGGAVALGGSTTINLSNVSVANGGTGRTTLTANNVLIGNGTGAVNFVAPSTNGNFLTSDGTTWISASAPIIGSGQTWQSVSRSAGTTYTNSTGKPIVFLMSFGAGSSSSDVVVLTIGGVSINFIYGILVSGVVFGQNMAIIPIGATYSYTQGSSVGKSIYELR